jgi:hypothetical protein
MLEGSESLNVVTRKDQRPPECIDFMVADPERFRLYRSSESMVIENADPALSDIIDNYLNDHDEVTVIKTVMAPKPVEQVWEEAIVSGTKPRKVVRAETCFEGQTIVVEGGVAIEIKGNRYLLTTNYSDPKCFHLVYFSEDILLEDEERVSESPRPYVPEAGKTSFKVYLEYEVEENGEVKKHQEYRDVDALTFPEAIQKAKRAIPGKVRSMAAVDASEPEVTFD